MKNSHLDVYRIGNEIEMRYGDRPGVTSYAEELRRVSSSLSNEKQQMANLLPEDLKACIAKGSYEPCVCARALVYPHCRRCMHEEWAHALARLIIT